MTLSELPNEKTNFSNALIHLKEGKRVTRKGWHGIGMYLELQKPQASSDVCKMTLPYIYITTEEENLVPWIASQTDLLAEDWKIVE